MTKTCAGSCITPISTVAGKTNNTESICNMYNIDQLKKMLDKSFLVCMHSDDFAQGSQALTFTLLLLFFMKYNFEGSAPLYKSLIVADKFLIGQ